MALLRARTLRTVTPGSTGTADFTISGIGTPIAAKFELVVARLDSTDSAPAVFSRGFWANNGNIGCVAQASEDNTATGDTYSSCSSGRAGHLISIGGAEFLSFSVDSVITDGLRLNFHVATGLAHRLTITFYYGSGVSAHVGTFNMADNTGSPNATLDVTAPGFQPDFIEMCYGGAAFTSGTPTINNGIEVSYGMAARSSGGVQQIALGYSLADALTTTAPSIHTDESHVIYPVIGHASTVPLTSRHQIQLDSFLSTGFRVKDTKGSNPNEVLYLAIRWGGRNCDITKVQTPVTASTVNVDLNKRPHYLCSINTAMTAVGSRANAQAGQFGFGVADRFDQSVWMQRETDAATTTDNAIQARDDYFVKATAEDGTGGHQATVTFNDDNYDLVFDAAFISARFIWVAQLEEAIEGAGAATLGKITSAGVGREVFVGTGAPVLGKITAAAAGREVFRATGAPVLGKISANGTGTHPVLGGGAPVLPKISAAGAGNVDTTGVTGNGNANLPAIQSAGTGRQVFQGSGSPTLGKITSAGAGQLVLQASGAPVLPKISGAGAGLEVFRGSGSPTLPAIQCAAEGVSLAIIVGTGAPVLPKISATATGSSGQQTFTGNGAATLGKISANGAGREVFRATGSPTLGKVSAAGAGREVMAGSGAPVLPLISSSGQGREVFVASGAPTLGKISGAGQGRTGFVGAGAVLLPSIQAAGAGNVSIIVAGTGAPLLPLISGAGAGALVIRGAGAATLGKISCFGTSAAALVSVAELRAGYKSLKDFSGSVN